MNLADSFEKIPISIFPNLTLGSKEVATQIALLIKEKQRKKERCVLGLATGSTPKTLYAELVRLHKEEHLSFKNVVTFNLDEYYPIANNALQSYSRFMQEQLFMHIDIPEKNIHFLNGEITKDKVKEHCLQYEDLISKYGGIDLQILGIGKNGHIGFNEPGSSINSKTRLISLDNATRIANAFEFPNISQVPRLALTVGIREILKAKKIILMAWGNSKATIIKRAVQDAITENVPASFLQNHANTQIILDESAASQLTRNKSPWLTGECDWTPKLIKKAVVNMALQLNKSILSLTTKDYNEYGLSDLLVEHGSAYEINLQVYYQLRDSITGWPAGKPNANLPNHPERSQIFPKRCLLFSPHPDDDIISMGGTLQRLVDQNNEVHIGYQTSGNIAVTNEFALRFLDFTAGFEEIAGMDTKKSHAILSNARKLLSTKNSHQKDALQIRAIKGLIRRCEAIATCRYVGIPPNSVHFMNLPFYETGTIAKKPLSKKDLEITMQLLQKIKPHQIYCAGDFSDPHGTHITCFNLIIASLRKLTSLKEAWLSDCTVWLYKGAWEEWEMEDIDMAIPLSPDQVLQKRYGIFIHQSQKDIVPFQGTDSREFWQRAEERNATTATNYAALGLTHYAAMEAFVKYAF